MRLDLAQMIQRKNIFWPDNLILDSKTPAKHTQPIESLIQNKYGWGKSVVKRLSADLKKTFAGTLGFSSQNLWDMRQLYLEYKDHPILQ